MLLLLLVAVAQVLLLVVVEVALARSVRAISSADECYCVMYDVAVSSLRQMHSR
jgi:hypothetical protein